LRIHFIRDGHDIREQQTEIQSTQILLQTSRRGLLAGFVNHAPAWQERSLATFASSCMRRQGAEQTESLSSPGGWALAGAFIKSSISFARYPVRSWSPRETEFKFFALFDLRQPTFDNFACATMQYRSHPLLVRPNRRLAGKQLVVKKINESPSLEWLNDDVGLQKGGDPAGIGNPGAIFSQTFRQEHIAEWAWKRYIDDSPGLDVFDFRILQLEFPTSNPMWMSRYIRPCQDFLFELLQIIHTPLSTVFSLPENDRSIR
jgi:hypothetical protein